MEVGKSVTVKRSRSEETIFSGVVSHLFGSRAGNTRRTRRRALRTARSARSLRLRLPLSGELRFRLLAVSTQPAAQPPAMRGIHPEVPRRFCSRVSQGFTPNWRWSPHWVKCSTRPRVCSWEFCEDFRRVLPGTRITSGIAVSVSAQNVNHRKVLTRFSFVSSVRQL